MPAIGIMLGLANAGQGGGGVVVPSAVYLPTVSASPSAVYGMRRLVAAYTGALIEVQRASDSTNMDVAQLANGLPDLASVVTWAAGSETRVRTVYDQSGNARHTTQTTFANMPLFDAAGVLGVYGQYGVFKALMFDGDFVSPLIAKTLVIPTSVAFNQNAVSVFITAEPHSALYNNGYLALGNFTNVTTAQSVAGIYVNRTQNNVGRRPMQKYHTFGFTSATSGASGFKFFQDGQIVSSAFKASAALTGATWGDTGAGASEFLSNNDNYLGLVIYAATLSDADAAAVKSAMDSTFGIVQPTTNQVVQVGDSILYCSRAATGQPSHKCQITSRGVNALLPAGTALYNLGVGSYTLALAQTNAATREFALATDLSYTKRCLFIQVATNDLGTNGGTIGYGATLYSNLTAYITNARAAGFNRIVVCTVLPRSNNANWTSQASQYWTELNDYNARVRANAAGADAISDRAAHPIMGLFANTSDTTYYQDALHPSALGYTLLVAEDARAINQALAA